jgi:hypothetical protein
MPNGPTNPKYVVKPAREKFSFDVEGAILFFGGFTTFQAQLLDNGMDAPTYNNFRGWRTRRTMSADLIARMTRLAQILDVNFDLTNYIIDPISMSKQLPPAAVKSGEPDPDLDGNERFSPSTPTPEAQAQPVAPAQPVASRAMRRNTDV